MASTHILLVGRIEEGEIHYDISPLPEDGLLQATIDEAEQTADYEDYLLDVEWLRGGC